MSRKHYPAAYREQIVKLAWTGRSVASLAQEFEPTEPTIRSWIVAANGTVPPEEVELRRELRQVQRKLARIALAIRSFFHSGSRSRWRPPPSCHQCTGRKRDGPSFLFGYD